MLSYAQFKKRNLLETINREPFRVAFHKLVEAFKYELIEVSKLSVNLTEANVFDAFLINQFISEDYKLNQQVFSQLLSDFEVQTYRSLLHEADAATESDLEDELVIAVDKAIKRLKSRIQRVLSGSRSLPPETTDTSVADSGTAPSTSAADPSVGTDVPPPPAPALPSGPSGSTSPAPASDVGSGDADRPERPTGYKPAPYGSFLPAPAAGDSGGMLSRLGRGIKNLGWAVTRPIRRAWHGDPTREQVENLQHVIYENEDVIASYLDRFHIQVLDLIRQRVSELKGIAGTSASAAPAPSTEAPANTDNLADIDDELATAGRDELGADKGVPTGSEAPVSMAAGARPEDRAEELERQQEIDEEEKSPSIQALRRVAREGLVKMGRLFGFTVPDKVQRTKRGRNEPEEIDTHLFSALTESDLGLSTSQYYDIFDKVLGDPDRYLNTDMARKVKAVSQAIEEQGDDPTPRKSLKRYIYRLHLYEAGKNAPGHLRRKALMRALAELGRELQPSASPQAATPSVPEAPAAETPATEVPAAETPATEAPAAGTTSPETPPTEVPAAAETPIASPAAKRVRAARKMKTQLPATMLELSPEEIEKIDQVGNATPDELQIIRNVGDAFIQNIPKAKRLSVAEKMTGILRTRGEEALRQWGEKAAAIFSGQGGVAADIPGEPHATPPQEVGASHETPTVDGERSSGSVSQIDQSGENPMVHEPEVGDPATGEPLGIGPNAKETNVKENMKRWFDVMQARASGSLSSSKLDMADPSVSEKVNRIMDDQAKAIIDELTDPADWDGDTLSDQGIVKMGRKVRNAILDEMFPEPVQDPSMPPPQAAESVRYGWLFERFDDEEEAITPEEMAAIRRPEQQNQFRPQMDQHLSRLRDEPSGRIGISQPPSPAPAPAPAPPQTQSTGGGLLNRVRAIRAGTTLPADDGRRERHQRFRDELNRLTSYATDRDLQKIQSPDDLGRLNADPEMNPDELRGRLHQGDLSRERLSFKDRLVNDPRWEELKSKYVDVTSGGIGRDFDRDASVEREAHEQLKQYAKKAWDRMLQMGVDPEEDPESSLHFIFRRMTDDVEANIGVAGIGDEAGFQDDEREVRRNLRVRGADDIGMKESQRILFRKHLLEAFCEWRNGESI